MSIFRKQDNTSNQLSSLKFNSFHSLTPSLLIEPSKTLQKPQKPLKKLNLNKKSTNSHQNSLLSTKSPQFTPIQQPNNNSPQITPKSQKTALNSSKSL